MDDQKSSNVEHPEHENFVHFNNTTTDERTVARWNIRPVPQSLQSGIVRSSLAYTCSHLYCLVTILSQEADKVGGTVRNG